MWIVFRGPWFARRGAVSAAAVVVVVVVVEIGVMVVGVHLCSHCSGGGNTKVGPRYRRLAARSVTGTLNQAFRY